MKHAAFAVLLALSLCMLTGALVSVANAEGELLWAPGELIVAFMPGTSEGQKAALISGHKIRDFRMIKAEHWSVEGQTTEEALLALNSNPWVDYAEPNYRLFTQGIPNDSRFGSQWSLDNTGQIDDDGIPGVIDADIDAPEAWDLFTGSSSAVVAVIDVGVDFTHNDLAGNIWINPGEIAGNANDDDGNGFIDDVHGWDFHYNGNDVSDLSEEWHGTHCAGIIGATGNNGNGIAGVNWNVRIMPLRAANTAGELYTAAAIAAVEYAVTMGADVINASFETPAYDQAFLHQIQAAYEADVFFVAASGNSGINVDNGGGAFPALYDVGNVISVMATDHHDIPWEHGNYGASGVDIAAPGVDVLSTVGSNEIGIMTGTSMAAPHVSGAMAMLRGLFPGVTADQGRALLLEVGRDPLPSLSGMCVSGGRLNLRKLIEAPDLTPPGEIIDLAVVAIGSSWVDLHWSATGDDGAVGNARHYDVRFATSAIVTEADWDAAIRATGEPAPQAPGAQETMRVDGLAASTTYYFAIRALDEINRGAISNCPDGMTMGPPTIAVAPISLSATTTIGSSESKNLQIANVGGGTLDYSVGRMPRWLSVTPNAGSVAAGGSTYLTLTFDSADLSLGFYSGYLQILSNDLVHPTLPVPLTLNVVNYSFDDNAVYRFRAGSTDTSHVLAISMASPPEFAHVTADLTAVAGPASVALSDDGAGEDVKAGDGIFTSPRFAASMPAVGTYVASVTALPVGGTLVTQSINMFAVTAAAKFTGDSEFDETERLGDALALGLAARPYSSVYFRASPNVEESKPVMVTTFDDNATPPGIWGRSLNFDGSDGPFVIRGAGPGGWLIEPLPAGSRGACYADFDNDGDTDFFLCNPTHGGKLYVNYLNDTNCPVDWQGKFINRTSAFCGADSVYLDGALAASWGDYTGDGFVDLFVATGTYTAPIDELDELPVPAQSGMSGGDLRLFKNTMGSALRKSLVWGSSTGAICLSGCWVDLDNDGDLDHVSTRYVDGGVDVLENHGINAARTDQVMEPVTWSIAEQFYGGNSVTVIDYDHDPYPDLLVTEVASGHQQARILRNRFGAGESREFDSTTFAVGQTWNGAVVADFNLDGQDDIVLLPRSADVVPVAFMSSAYMLAPEFEEWPAIQPTGDPTTPTYRDLGYTLGIRDGRTGGGFAADLDGDHAPDLFLGRDMVDSQGQSSGEQCLYRSTGSAGTANHRLQVNLRTRGDSNGSLIGTKVQVVAGGKQLMKAVDGGSFRGGQGSNDLLFGLGGETSIAQVSVVFPSGETKIISQPAIDSTLEVLEDDMDVLAYARPASALELEPGFVNWVFRWKTGSIKGDLREDKLEIYPYGGNPQDAVVLQWGAPNVNNVVYRESGVWTHEMRLDGLQCFEGARWTFRVSSSAGTGGETIALSAWSHTPAVTYCLPENYGQ